ncbi:hypothetical protein [Actinomadura geliboluensis]
MSEVLGVLLALAALPLVIRLGFGGGGGRVVLRFRVPLRHRFPCLFWSVVWFGLLVVLPVGWLGSSCGWWGP